MKKSFICAAMVLLLTLAGCAGSGVFRGVDEAGSLVSTSRPEFSVRPAEGFRTVLAGHTSCLALQKNGFTGTVNTQVWYGLSVRENAQLATVLAECPPEWSWSVGADSSDMKSFPTLLEMRGVAHNEPDILVYVRSAASDPWNRLLGESAWKEDILVARSEWLSHTNQEKVIVEYREPAAMPVDELLDKPQEVNAFAARARAAFAVESAAPAEKPRNMRRMGGVLSDAMLAPVLGMVSPSFDFLGF